MGVSGLGFWLRVCGTDGYRMYGLKVLRNSEFACFWDCEAELVQ